MWHVKTTPVCLSTARGGGVLNGQWGMSDPGIEKKATKQKICQTYDNEISVIEWLYVSLGCLRERLSPSPRVTLASTIPTSTGQSSLLDFI